MLGLFGFIKEELVKQDKLPDKYKDIVYSTESYCINPEGAMSYWDIYEAGVQQKETADGWKFYALSDSYADIGNVALALCAESYAQYPRSQALHPNAYIRFRTPQKGILTSYLITQYADSNLTGRICNDWEIIGFNSEQDLINLTNGTVLSHDGWDKVYANGTSKTIQVANETPFQYYAIRMINNFYNGEPIDPGYENTDFSPCSMGSTKLYMRMPVSTCINEDGVITSNSGGNGWTIYDKSTTYGEVCLMLNSSLIPDYPRWQVSIPKEQVTTDADYNYYAYLKTPEKCRISSYTTTVVYDESSSSPSKLIGRVCSHWQLVGYETEEDMLNLRDGQLLSENWWFTPTANKTKRVFLSSNSKKFQYYTVRMLKKYGGNSSNDNGWTYNCCSLGTTKFYVGK